jgi:hypothetical protein
MSNDTENVHGHAEGEPITDPKNGTWIRIQDGPATYLGRVYQLDFRDPYAPKGLNDPPKQAVSAQAIMMADILTLFPTYFFGVQETRVAITGPDGKPLVDPETRMPQVGLQRQPLIRGIDFNLHPTMMHFRRGNSIYVFSQQHKNDQATLRAFCQHAEELNEQHRKDAMAHQTGLTTSATPQDVAAEAERQRRVRRH